MSSPVPLRLGGQEFVDLLANPYVLDALASPAVFVELDRTTSALTPGAMAALQQSTSSLPVVLVLLRHHPSPFDELFDVCLEPDDPNIGVLTNTLATVPIASVTLALLLRAAGRRSIIDGLVAESAAYSLLQSGPEFAEWRNRRPVRSKSTEVTPLVLVERHHSEMRIVLNRPMKHNAFNAAMRDALCESLGMALIDDSVERVVLSGNGPSFCSGGDLDEFGSRSDPASAHIVRLTRSAARMVAALSNRVTVRLHGSCLGAGIELAAFAGRLVAHPDTRMGLPELALGLIPGAGGTVSLPRRIGRHRCAYLALTGATIDADTARAWGLIDAIEA